MARLAPMEGYFYAGKLASLRSACSLRRGHVSTTSNARQLNMTGIRGLHHHRVKMAFKVNQTMALLTQNDLCDVYQINQMCTYRLYLFNHPLQTG
ncbi:Uncharacterised protein [Yersinia pseudotuberculosis]|nr:Uncharacterised protein [Yersinia pseudotuberculosis]